MSVVRDDISEVLEDEQNTTRHRGPRNYRQSQIQPVSPTDAAYSRVPNSTEPHSQDLPEGTLKQRTWRKTTPETSVAIIEPDLSRTRGKKDRRIFSSWWWWWELGAALLSLICMSLIVVVLSLMDGKPLSDWTLEISPNAVVSVLTTVGKSGLMLLVAECISQLKWLHFDRTRRLSDLQAFDDASRGPWGAFVFFWHTRGTALVATVGCFVTLVSLGFEPTAQQVLDFPLRLVEASNETGTMATTSHFGFNGSSGLSITSLGGVNGNVGAPSLPLQLAVFTGLTNEIPQIDSSCTTSECHFGNVTSLALCSSCEDLTSKITPNCTYQYKPPTVVDHLDPNDPTLKHSTWSCAFDTGDLTNPTMEFYEGMWPDNATVMTVTARLGGTFDFYNDMRASLTVTKRMNTSGYQDLNKTRENIVKLNRCELSWCARTYPNLTIVNGILKSDAVKDEPLTSIGDKTMYLGQKPYELAPNSTRDKNYTVDIVSDTSLFSHLVSLFNKDLSGGRGQTVQPDSVLHLLYQQDVSNVTKNIALAITNKFQESGTNRNATTLSGIAMRQETFVHVRWAWLILPIGLTILGAVLLLVSIILGERREEPLLKSSALAMLFHGTEGFSSDEMKPPAFEDLDTLSEKAKSMKVELRWNEEGVMKFAKID